jgi:hypothetical protein
MSIQQKVTKALNVQAAESFTNAIRNDGNYYVFASKHTPFEGSAGSVPIPSDTTKNDLAVYDEMLFGKRVRPDQVINMIRRYNWTSGTVYAMYSDSDAELDTKQFYIVADEGTNLNVYKCLNNNNGAISTQKPSGTSTTPIELPLDGYVWKYMFAISDFDTRKFATTDFVPVVPDTAITAAAVPGSIEVVTVQDGGAGYRNYTVGAFPEPASIQIGGSGIKYGLDANASSISNFYNNCLIKITNGPANNQYRLITNYTSTNKVITLDRQFDEGSTPLSGNTYEIYPAVFVYDLSGTSIQDCVARALIDPNKGYMVSSVEVLNVGEGYRNSRAEIIAAADVNVTANATLTPIVSPIGGHGFNVYNELFAKYVGIAASFSGNTSPLVATNDFHTVGILKDPLYANVSVDLDPASIVGSFNNGENLFRYRSIQLSSNVSVYANSLVVGTNTEFVDSLRTNDRVILTNGLTNLFANVSSIINDTSFIIDKTPSANSFNQMLYYIESEYFAQVDNYQPGTVTLTNTVPAAGDLSMLVIGEISGCTARVANSEINVRISGRAADEFNAFNQLTTLVGDYNSIARFEDDEIVVEGTGPEAPSAIVHSSIDNIGSEDDRLVVSTVSRTLQANATVIGATSNARFTIRDKYNGDLVPDSGEILYLENTMPITRNPRQTENIRLILEF